MPQFRSLPKLEEPERAALVEETGEMLPARAPHTTARVPVLLLSGPQRTPATEQLAALASKPIPTSEHPSLLNALQTSLNPARAAKRPFVIHAETKRKKKSNAPARHMSLRLRHAIVISVTLVVLFGLMVSLSPLSDGANGRSFFQNFSSWIQSVQSAFGIPAQGYTVTKADLNANLPFMNIPDSPYVSLAEQDAFDAHISPIYFVRQINQESGFNPNAVSVTNAQGIAQFEPGTAAGLGINPLDPAQALRGAAQLMFRYSQKYGGYAKALAAYNAGSANLLNAVNACGANWLSCTPAQTRDYVHRIMGL